MALHFGNICRLISSDLRPSIVQQWMLSLTFRNWVFQPDRSQLIGVCFIFGSTIPHHCRQACEYTSVWARSFLTAGSGCWRPNSRDRHTHWSSVIGFDPIVATPTPRRSSGRRRSGRIEVVRSFSSAQSSSDWAFQYNSITTDGGSSQNDWVWPGDLYQLGPTILVDPLSLFLSARVDDILVNTRRLADGSDKL